MESKLVGHNEPSKAPELGYLLALRLCLLAIGLFSATIYISYYNVYNKTSLFTLYGPIAFLFGFSALSALWLKRNKAGKFFTYIQFAADVAFVTLIIWMTGGHSSSLLYLYMPIVFSASYFTNRTFAFAVSIFSLSSLCSLIFGLNTGFIPYFNSVDYLSREFKLVEFGFQFIGVSSSLILSVIAGSHIQKIALLGHQLAHKANSALHDFKSSRISIENELQEGVITTDIQGNITHANQSAQNMLKFELVQVLNTSFSELLTKIIDQESLKKIDNNLEEFNTEFELSSAHGNGTNNINYSVKPIIATNGETTGRVHVFMDITSLRQAEAKLAWQDNLQQLMHTENHNDSDTHSILPNFIGETPVMKKVFRIINRVANSDASILISGESGTGKELVAKALHVGSDRAHKPFVAVNCGAIPENLIESQLFGHKKGSFTGATTDFKGFFQEANGGTIFLDEIGELPLHLQSKLLRVLQEKVVRSVGADHDVDINVRVVSASNKNLKTEVSNGQFREDLFYRLNVIAINLPPLRERKDDIPLLVKSLIRRLQPNEELPTIVPQSIELLINYNYPGNIRELENILERALVLGGNVILPEHLPDTLHNSSSQTQFANNSETEIIVNEQVCFPLNLDQILGNIESKYLKTALLQSNGVKTKAAELLGMNFRSFRYRLQKYGIDQEVE